MINPMHISRDNIQQTHKENLWRLKLILAGKIWRAFPKLLQEFTLNNNPYFCFREGTTIHNKVTATKCPFFGEERIIEKKKQMKLNGFIKRTTFRGINMSINHTSMNCVGSWEPFQPALTLSDTFSQVPQPTLYNFQISWRIWLGQWQCSCSKKKS